MTVSPLAVLNTQSSANAFALFVKSQRKWTSPALTEDSVASFKARMNEFGYSPSHVLVHGSYLVNLGNPDDERREKSYQCFLDEIRRCEQLGLELYNFHPGSTVGKTTKEHSISLIGECINRVHQEVPSIIVVIENMAGAGNTVGSEFWELRAIIDCVMDKCRVGICLDTCHLYAACNAWVLSLSKSCGYSSIPVVAEFDKVVGLGYLRGVHINDARTTLGSKKDRHENIALGPLAFAFRAALTDPRTRNLPLILETPTHGTDMDSDGVWASEIRILYQMADIPSGIGDVGNDEEGDGTARDTVSGSANDEQMKSLMEQMRNVVAAAKWKSDGRPKKRNKSRKRAVDDADEQDSQADKSKGD
ncbi:hypothetical protein ID866_9606 [Astraeus odoratus]|nr:hypothetical protein ID866_9606 [Astraeus odoratus]